MKAPRIALAALALSGTLPPFALGAQTADTSRLHPIVVSATKGNGDLGSLTQAVTVISGRDLRARGVTRVTDALGGVPGAALVQSGSFGYDVVRFIRGGESRY